MFNRLDLFHRIQFGLVLSLSLLIAIMSRRTMIKIGRFLGGFAYHLWQDRRRIALSNLDLALGEFKTRTEKEWIVKEAFKNMAATVMELGWGIRRMNQKVFDETVIVEGLQILRSALSRGKGAIILPAHYGNWEIMANAVGYLKFNAHYVAKRLNNPYIDKLVNIYRCKTGNKVIYMNGASKEMEDALSQGGVVATLLDQKVSRRRGGIMLKFFGADAPTTPLIAQLHLKTSAPLIPVRCYPLADGRCRLVFGPEIRFEPSGNMEGDIRRLTQQCLDFIEAYIRADPQYWIWGHKRWKVFANPMAYNYLSKHVAE